MKRIYILFTVMCCLLCGCSSSEIELPDYINSSVKVNIDAIKGDSPDFMIYFSHLYDTSKEELSVEIGNYEYEIGSDVKLTGTNVSALKGSTVNVNVSPMSDYLTDAYFETVAPFVNADAEDGKTVTSGQLKKNASRFISSWNMVSFSMYIYGNIESDVTVESMYISSMNLTYDFDEFKINVKELDDDTKLADWETPITISSGMGTWFSGVELLKENDDYLQGTATVAIQSIKVKSMNDVFYVKDDEKEYVTSVVEEGRAIPNIDYTFVYNGDETETDSAIASIEIDVTDESGQKYIRTIYTPIVREGAYLIIPYINGAE